MLAGAMRGGTTCGRRIGTEFKIDEVAPAKGGFGVKGTYQTFDLPGQERAPHHETPWAGAFDPATGILQLQSTVLPPKDPKACPKGFETLFGKKMECSSNFLGVIGEKISAQNAKTAAELAAASKFVAVVGRNAAGDGWRGTIVNPAFDCPELSLHQQGGAGPRALPPINAEAAYTQADFFMRNGSPATAGSSHVYWLTMAAEQGHRDANAYLGRTYELGEGAKQDFALAAKYFRVAAEGGDARAQTSLSHLLAQGQGVGQDVAESERWARLAQATRLEASKVCVAEVAVAGFERLMLASLNDPTVKVAEFLGGAFMGVQINSGSFRILSVAAKAISSIDRPFLCEVVAKRIGTSFTNIKPDWEVVDHMDNGDLVVHDQRFEASMNQAMAQGATALANAVPWIQSFQVAPQGGTQFKLTMQQQLIAMSRDYATLIDLNAGAGVAAAPRTERIERPVAEPVRNAASTAQFDAIVNDKLIDWASSWMMDRYSAGTAHVSKSECRPGGCAVSGTFSFFRGAAPLTIPFYGTLEARGGAYALTRLCYTDTTSGQQACTR